jgi:very-short-patch-repair endonuclease
MTPPELRLWAKLRAGGLEGLKFRRQHPLGPYVLDFYCDRARLCVEVDGWSHNLGDRPGHDLRRDMWLAAEGVRTLRLAAADVMKDLDAALLAIRGACALPLLPQGEGGANAPDEGSGARRRPRPLTPVNSDPIP